MRLRELATAAKQRLLDRKELYKIYHMQDIHFGDFETRRERLRRILKYMGKLGLQGSSCPLCVSSDDGDENNHYGSKDHWENLLVFEVGLKREAAQNSIL